MRYSDSIHESSEYLRLALSHMGQHQIPVDPANYAVWYEYVSGKNEKLKAVMDDILANSRGFSPELNISLYEKYIALDHKEIVEKIRSELRSILENILEHVAHAGGQVKSFGRMIRKYSRDLNEELDVDAVSRVVEGILFETKNIVLSGEQLKDRLRATTDEVEKLSRNLDQVREQATTDTLTGIRNRRYLSTAFVEEAGQADETGRELCVIFADIDHFKSINDTYGHLIGDRVLRITAEVLRDCVKGKDLVVRYGGEEFVILLPDTPLKGALILADKICTYFRNLNWRRKDTSEFIGPVSLSFGVARYRTGETLEDLIKRADQALYKSKLDGRCRVTSEMEIVSGPRRAAAN